MLGRVSSASLIEESGDLRDRYSGSGVDGVAAALYDRDGSAPSSRVPGQIGRIEVPAAHDAGQRVRFAVERFHPPTADQVGECACFSNQLVSTGSNRGIG